MSFLVVLECFLLVISFTEALKVPVVVEIEPEHRIVVRSTPSLDPTEELLEKFGNENQMNLTDMETLFTSIGLLVLKDNDTEGKSSVDRQTCFTSQHFYGMYSRNDGNINKTDLMALCPAVLYQMTKKQCHAEVKKEVIEVEVEGKENPTRAWGYGFLFVTIISFGSLIGAFVVPLMEKPFYKKTLMCMVSLAVGVLGGSGIFHLIPSALGFPFDDDDNSYLWKCAMIFAGLYLFFVLECTMKLYIRFKDMRRKEKAALVIGIPQEEKPASSGGEIHSIGITDGHGHSHATHSHSHNGETYSNGGIKNKTTIDSQTKLTIDSASTEQIKISEKTQIATVAWMIIIGDGLHNFIDGLAIGASFTGSVVMGMSTSLAVICEELPHELGDFAILLNSGLTYKQAMLANFLSACCCYIGLVIGLVLGYATSAVKYIYGVAGGMFLYISLVDMLPEALEMAHSLSGNSRSRSIKMLLLVNVAIIFGFMVMLVLAFYATSIEL